MVDLQLDDPMSLPTPPASFRTLLRRFRRNRRASAALEFAMVAPVFFALLFAIIETALTFFASQVLETITQDSSRAIFTGQAQNASLTPTQFATCVCSRVPALFDCSNLWIDVQSYKSFSNVTINNPVDAGGNFVSPQFSPVQPGDVVVVRLGYKWPIFVTGLGYNIANLPGSKRLLTASAAFKVEPYPSVSTPAGICS
jgi:Flp pilus assembly protein TadG